MTGTSSSSKEQARSPSADGSSAKPAPATGLEGVVVAQTSISTIDGSAGKLSYRGYDIHDLAEHSTFEETAFLLWEGRLPDRGELEAVRRELREQRALPPEAVALLESAPRQSNPMAVLRTITSAIALTDPDADDNAQPALRRKAVRLTAQLGPIVAGFHRHRQGAARLEPREHLDYAGNFLYLLNGREPTPEEARIFDVCLILHADHGFNASTFSARVTVATLSDIYSGVTSALGTLKGSLHGGANEAVMKMLLELQGSGESPEDAIRRRLERKEKISGFGHRVYKTEDPRATHLRRFSEELGSQRGDGTLFEMSRRIEAFMRAEKDIYSNVDFYSASTYYQLGIPTDLFTPIFAMSRVAGWTAHVMEQLANNRLIRPRSEYVGERNLRYVSLEQR
ncbi:MAG: citrate synthase [Gemmatimonadetes bacterium]|nr:citrate synthase [Gemmatimonadota bacterium]